MMLLDTHYHLEFLDDISLRHAFLQECALRRIGIVGQTVLPSSYAALMEEEAVLAPDAAEKPKTPPFGLALGFHPWWVGTAAQNEAELALIEKWLPTTHYIGEIGLDFSPRRLEVASEARQLHVFRTILAAAVREASGRPAFGRLSEEGNFVLSIHAVQSATTVLNELEAVEAVENGLIPILHRFSGNSDELTRLMRMGGYISVHPRMLMSKRGRAYVQQIPGERLLLETDLPPRHSIYAAFPARERARREAEDVAAALQETYEAIATLRRDDVKTKMEQTQHLIFPDFF